jgi:uncharacterized protein (DUF362 family)
MEAEQMSAIVAITQDMDIERAVAEALGHLPLEALVRGKLVAVKPNETWASPEDTTGVTQADTLRAVLQALRRFAPRELVVSGGAGAAETEEVFRYAGLMDVIEQEGATFFDHNRPPFVSVDLDYAPNVDIDGPQRAWHSRTSPCRFRPPTTMATHARRSSTTTASWTTCSRSSPR